MADLTLQSGHDGSSAGPPAPAELLRVVRRHLGLALAVFAAIALAVAAITLALKPRYTALATVYVTPETPDPLDANQAANSAVADDQVATVATLLQGRDIAAPVVRQLGIGAEPAEPSLPLRALCGVAPRLASCAAPPSATADQRVSFFLGHLTASAPQHARIIELSYTDADPARAAAALNALVVSFQQQQIGARAGDLQRTSIWLGRRAGELRDRWLQAEGKVAVFRADHGLATGGTEPGGQTLVGQQVAHAASDLATAQADLAAAQARQAAMHAAGNGPAASQIAQQPTLVALAAELSQLEVRSAALHAQLGGEHPGLVSIDRQVAAARSALAAETARARQGIDTDVAAKRSAVAALQANLAGLNHQAGGMSGSQSSLATLVNEAADARTTYDAFLSREKQLDDRSQLLQPQVLFASHAAVPDVPSFPNRPRFIAAGLVLGLLGGIAAALVREHLNRGFANISRVSEAVSLPLLSAVPMVGAPAPDLPFYVEHHPYSATAESIRSLAAGLRGAGGAGRAPRSLVVASATVGEGKTTLAIWLARALAAAGQRVLLIDGDHRRGCIGHRLGLGNDGPGFTELLSGRAMGERVVQDGVDYMGPGQRTARAFGEADVARLRTALTAFRAEYDLVIIDTPPLLAMADALLWSRAVDATAFVCRWNSTSQQAVRGCLHRLKQSGATVLGIVLSMVDQSRLSLFSDEYAPRDVRLIQSYYSNG